MSEFQVGDRVMCHLGMGDVPGTIVKIEKYHIVKFDEFNQKAYECGFCGFGELDTGCGIALGGGSSMTLLDPVPVPAPDIPRSLEFKCRTAWCGELTVIGSIEEGHVSFLNTRTDSDAISIHLNSEDIVELRDHLDLLLGDVIHEQV